MPKPDPFALLMIAGMEKVTIELDDEKLDLYAHQIAFYSAVLEAGKSSMPFDEAEKETFAYLKKKRKQALKLYMKRTDKLVKNL